MLYKAREEGLSEWVIQDIQKGAGLWLYNPCKVSASSQVLGRPSTPLPRLQTSDMLKTIYSTSQSLQALYKAQRILRQSEYPSRSTRLVLRKASKAISRANTWAAKSEAENRKFVYKLSKLLLTRLLLQLLKCEQLTYRRSRKSGDSSSSSYFVSVYVYSVANIDSVVSKTQFPT